MSTIQMTKGEVIRDIVECLHRDIPTDVAKVWERMMGQKIQWITSDGLFETEIE